MLRLLLLPGFHALLLLLQKICEDLRIGAAVAVLPRIIHALVEEDTGTACIGLVKFLHMFFDGPREEEGVLDCSREYIFGDSQSWPGHVETSSHVCSMVWT